MNRFRLYLLSALPARLAVRVGLKLQNPSWLTPARVITLSITLLSGCASHSLSGNKDHHTIKLPEKQVADFLLTSCPDLWQISDQSSDNNPLYWLRAIECGKQLTEQQASQHAASFSHNSWQDALRRAILLANVKMTSEQRQQYITQLNSLSDQVPPSVWSLFQLWRTNQDGQLSLAQQRARYHKLQQTTDSELDALRQQLQDVRQQLSQTTRKLESLTDIERQLSSRKAAENFIQSGGHSPDSDKTTTDTPKKQSATGNEAPVSQKTTDGKPADKKAADEEQHP